MVDHGVNHLTSHSIWVMTAFVDQGEATKAPALYLWVTS